MKNLKNSMMLGLGIFVLLSAFTLAEMKTELILWESKTHDFGLIEKGESVSQTFYFSNDSEKPIQIVKTKTSCGCTVSEYSQDEIAPGNKGFVKAVYSSTNSGVFSKTISVYTSVQEDPILLRIKGEVK